MFEFRPFHNFKGLTLLYFPLRARAEALRMLFRHAKVPFVNEVVPFSEWPALKPNVPQSELPQLQLGSNGRLMPGTTDIALHIAGIAGAPLLPRDELQAEQALDCWRELHGRSLAHVGDPWGETTPWNARIGAVNPLLNALPEQEAIPLVPRYLAGLQLWFDTVDARLCEGQPGVFMGGATPHHGDFASFAIADNICTLGGAPALAAASPALHEWLAAMRALPAVSGHLETRPPAGTGAVGMPGSLLFNHADPAAAVAHALSARTPPSAPDTEGRL